MGCCAVRRSRGSECAVCGLLLLREGMVFDAPRCMYLSTATAASTAVIAQWVTEYVSVKAVAALVIEWLT